MPKKKSNKKTKKDKPALIPLPPKKLSQWIWLAIIIIVIVSIISIIFGQGYLNLGALRFTTKGQKADQQASYIKCPAKSVQEGPYCVFTLNPPLEYYTIKDGDNFLFYGPIVSKRYNDNGWNFKEGDIINGAAYSIVKNGFTPMTLTFKLIEKKGKLEPAFVFDYATAEKIQGSRFVDVTVAKDKIIRFEKFNIPDKNLIHR